MSDPENLKPTLSLSNIDINQIIPILVEHQGTVLKAAVVIGSLIIASSMFNDQRLKEQKLRVQISQAQQKLDALSNRQKAIKNFSDFKTSFPKGVSAAEIITQITNFATARGVSITSLSPAQSQDMGLYDVINVNLAGEASDYKAMVLFLRDIEKSTYFFRVDTWSGQSNQNQGTINFTMSISAVRVHL